MKKFIVLSAVLAFLGCDRSNTPGNGMAISIGAAVKIHYKLTVEEKLVDSSIGRGPLSFVYGSGQIIPGLEEQLVGLKAGDKKNVTVSPEKGYGPINPEAFQKVPLSSLKDTKNIKVGNMISGNSNGKKFRAVIAKIGSEEITLNLNHPLAGKILNFEIEVIEVRPGA